MINMIMTIRDAELLVASLPSKHTVAQAPAGGGGNSLHIHNVVRATDQENLVSDTRGSSIDDSWGKI
jgi:hypothetical protein